MRREAREELLREIADTIERGDRMASTMRRASLLSLLAALAVALPIIISKVLA